MRNTAHIFLKENLPDIYNSDSNGFTEVVESMEAYAEQEFNKLRNYVDHIHSCGIYNHIIPRCTCGLDELLKE